MICEVYGEAIIMLLLLINDRPISHSHLKLWAMSWNSLSFNVSEGCHFEMHILIYLIFVLLYFVFCVVFNFLLYFMYVCCVHRALLEISFTEQTPCLNITIIIKELGKASLHNILTAPIAASNGQRTSVMLNL